MNTALVPTISANEADFEEADNPFVGLRAYEAEESYLFFGRGKQTTELLEKLNSTRLIGVVGSSGCGKSSLIKAGLIPKLKAGFLTGERDQWMIASMRPSGSPLPFLAEALNAAINSSSFIPKETRRFPDYTFMLMKGIKEKGTLGITDLLLPLFENSRTNLLLLVDQFEELFTIKRSDISPETQKNENIIFVNILLTLARQKDIPVYVIITMRSDYIGNCNKFYGLPEALNDGQYLVPRLNRQQVQEIIELPIKSYGQKISPRLLDQLLNDSDKDLDQLPVLQHCLMRTYQNWLDKPVGNVIEFEQYEAAGKLDKALSNHANEIYEKFTDKQKKVAEVIFRSLTDVNADNDPIRRRQSLHQLTEVAKSIPNTSQQDVTSVIDAFRNIDCAFLAPVRGKLTENTIIDISHESLMRQWDRLKEWMKAEQASGIKYKWLSESVSNKREALRGIDLKDALNWQHKQQPNEAWAVRYGGAVDEVDKYLKQSKHKSRVFNAALYSGILAFVLFLLIFSINTIASKQKANQQKLLDIKRSAEIEKIKLETSIMRNQDSLREQQQKEHEHELEDAQKRKEASAAFTALELKLRLVKSQQQEKEKEEKAQAALLQKENADKLLVINKLQKTVFYLSGKIEQSLKESLIDTLLGNSKRPADTLKLENHVNVKLLRAFDSAALATTKFSEDPKKGLEMAVKVWTKNKNRFINQIFLADINKNLFYKQAISPSPDNILSSPVTVFNHDKTRFAISDGNGQLFLGKYQDKSLSIDDSYIYSYKNPYSQTDTSAGSYNSFYNFNFYNDNLIGVQANGKLIKTTGKGKKILATLNNRNESNQIQFSPDSHYLITTPGDTRNSLDDNNRAVKLWKVHEDSLSILQVLDSSSLIKQAAFSPDSKLLFMLYTDGRFKLWKTGEKKPVFDTASIYSASFTPQNNNTILTSINGYLNVVDSSGKLSYRRKRILYNAGYLKSNSFSISADWKKIILKSNERYMLIENRNGDSLIQKSAATTRAIQHEFSDNLYINNAAFLDTNAIFTISNEGKINLWHTYKNFTSFDDAIAKIEVPAATVAERLAEGSIDVDALINNGTDADRREAAEYFEQQFRNGEKPDKSETYFNNTKRIYRKLLENSGDNQNHAYYYLFKLTSLNNEYYSLDISKIIDLQKENIGLLEEYKAGNRLLTQELSRTYGRIASHQTSGEQYNEAIENLRKGIDIYPSNDYMYVDLARTYLLLKQFKEAKEIYIGFKDKMFADSSNSFREAFLGDFADMQSSGLISTKKPELFIATAEIRAMLLQDKIKEEEALLSDKRNNQPDSVFLKQLATDYNNRAYYLLFTKNYRESIVASNTGLARSPGTNVIYTNLALAYLFSNQYEKALKIYTDNMGNYFSDGTLPFKKGFIDDFTAFEEAGIISKNDSKLYQQVSDIKKMLNK